MSEIRKGGTNTGPLTPRPHRPQQRGTDPSPSGLKLDDGKARLDLLPPFAIAALGDVLTYGAKKYAPDNWRHVPDARRRYIAAALRHILQDMSGERCDCESGLPQHGER